MSTNISTTIIFKVEKQTKSFPVRSCRKSFDPYPPLPEAVRAENAVYKYLDKDTVSGQRLQGRDHAECSSKEDQFDKSSHQPEEEEEDKVIEDEVEASAEDDERVSADDESVKRM
ncbi:unnamed protein product [Brassica rapa subsp. narinosa]